jgi:hypothetical protein
MEDQSTRLDEALSEVMTRFRDFFVEQTKLEHVALRHRSDFAAPLVTVMGYTFGVRLVEGEGKAKAGNPTLGVEVSVNVYDDEFQLDRFRSHIKDAHQPSRLRRTVENFMSSEDAAYVEREGPLSFSSFFSYGLEDDVRLVEKQKDTPSRVTGRLVDSVLVMRYWIEPDKLDPLSADLNLFASAVHLYCLRTFVLAYHQSVIPT